MKLRSKALQVPLICVVSLLLTSLPATSEPIYPDNGVSVTNETSAGAAFGVPVTPSVYLINFILLYFTNPEIAANMPAYRARLPQEVYKCLIENPDGCSYADMAQYFDERATYPPSCSDLYWTAYPALTRTWTTSAIIHLRR
jgi:hypothetical protein